MIEISYIEDVPSYFNVIAKIILIILILGITMLYRYVKYFVPENLELIKDEAEITNQNNADIKSEK